MNALKKESWEKTKVKYQLLVKLVRTLLLPELDANDHAQLISTLEFISLLKPCKMQLMEHLGQLVLNWTGLAS